jgi:acyl-CoA thioester hydrolase
MSKFRFQQSISIRYSDLDPQWHVNNARFLSYIEQARMNYLLKLGLFDGHHFWDLPLIVADMHVRYLAPIELTDSVVVSLGVTRIGNKSLLLECEIASDDGSVVYATAENTMVAYDYRTKTAVPVSDELREVFGKFEGKSFKKEE